MALPYNPYLYRSLDIGAYGAINLLKLLNKYVTAPTDWDAMKLATQSSLMKLRNLAAQVALSTLWLWI